MTEETTPLPTTTPAEPAPRRRTLRPVVLGVVAGVAAAAITAGGIAIATGLDRDEPLQISSTQSPSTQSPSGVDPTPLADPTPSPSVDDDVRPGDPDYDRVTEAALVAVGGGTVLEVDRGDDPGDAAWKVEILLANGDEAEVRLDADLTVIRIELDHD